MGHFYWLRVKSSNHLHRELSLGYPKDTEFCLESKASFIDICSIASFKRCLAAWLREYSAFSDSPGLVQNTSIRGLFSKKKLCSTIKLFSSSNMFFIRLFLANTVLV